jgi:hypothetical protein
MLKVALSPIQKEMEKNRRCGSPRVSRIETAGKELSKTTSMSPSMQAGISCYRAAKCVSIVLMSISSSMGLGI